MSQKYCTERLYMHPNPAIRYIENKRVQVILDLLVTTDGSSVLDIGCGEAYVTKRLDGDVVALDLSRSALHLAKSRLRAAGHTAQLVLADAQCLPFRDHSFDKAVCSETLEHVPFPFRLLSEASRVVRGGGTLVATLPNEQNINRVKSLLRKFGLFKLLLRNVPDRMDQEWHLHVFDLGHAKRMIESSGFDIVRTVSIPPLATIRWVFLCRMQGGVCFST